MRAAVLATLAPRGLSILSATFGRISYRAAVRDMSALGIGALLSQSILFLSSPILLRLYSPADFGLFTLLYTTVGLLATLCNWKVERLIIIVPSRREALLLLTALAVVSIGGGALLLVLTAGIAAAGWRPFDANILWPVPFAMAAVAISAGLRALLIRMRAFGAVAVAQVTRSTVFTGGAIVTALLWPDYLLYGALAMLLWQVVGDLAALLVQAWSGRRTIRVLLLRPHLAKAAAAVRSHRRMLGALGVSQVICSINHQVPISAAAFVFGPVYAGWYSLANSLVAVPCSVVSAAASEVTTQRLARLYADQKPISQLVVRVSLGMALVGFAPFLGIALLAPSILPVVMGPRWVEAGPVVAILAIASYLFFVESPAGHVAPILGARRYILVWQVLRCISLAFAAGLALFGAVSFTGWLVLMVVGDGLLYLLEIAAVYYLARRMETSWRTGSAG